MGTSEYTVRLNVQWRLVGQRRSRVLCVLSGGGCWCCRLMNCSSIRTSRATHAPTQPVD